MSKETHSKSGTPKAYDPHRVEDEMYVLWERSGFFNPDNLPGRRTRPFAVIMPPPNANGALHIGHAVFATLQDIMIRFERMRGKKTLWLPGADHAGFETQVVFEKKLEKEGRNRFEIPRDRLWREMWEFTAEHKKVMERQLRKLGASCDWSREKFTLDPGVVAIVNETFRALYEDGLMYRGERIVNWCPKHQTSLSDLETKYVSRADPLYYIRYGPLVLATVRPETKFGDTAVAVHPKDKRYQKYVGKEIEIETLLGPAKIKVIADAAVDPDFGTGVVKVTPAHDPADFEMGKRHNLEVREVIDRFGKLNEKTGPYAGLKVAEAREKIAADMQERGLMQKIDPSYEHSVAVCYKCGTVLEPRVMPQWFVRMTEKLKKGKKSLRDMAVEAVRSGKIKFLPKSSEKVFFHWMKNLRDWNISRQIVWGIRIPAWFCEKEFSAAARGEIRLSDSAEPCMVGNKKSEICPRCGEGDLVQDPDVLDTWFSSGQWPFAALGYPKGKDFKTFYPTDVMETGVDILFFWVARMIMLGLYHTGKVPFKTVYLHGLVRDKDRQKMSKSKGNVIDPLGIAEQYGMDAVRFALVVGNLPGQDIVISEEKIRGYRNFANKLWNIQRFMLLKVSNGAKGARTKATYRASDKKRLLELKAVAKRITEDLERFRFHHAAETLYHYIWHTFADKIIEEAKPRLDPSNPDFRDRAAARALLLEIHRTNLKLLHPFMPFITEALWQELNAVAEGARARKGIENLLMIEPWPAK